MGENLHDVDKLFKTALDQHEEKPSGQVWENIDKHLDKKKLVFLNRKYRKWKWVAAACFIVSLGMGMYLVQTKIIRDEAESNIHRDNKTNSAPIGLPDKPLDGDFDKVPDEPIVKGEETDVDVDANIKHADSISIVEEKPVGNLVIPKEDKSWGTEDVSRIRISDKLNKKVTQQTSTKAHGTPGDKLTLKKPNNKEEIEAFQELADADLVKEKLVQNAPSLAGRSSIDLTTAQQDQSIAAASAGALDLSNINPSPLKLILPATDQDIVAKSKTKKPIAKLFTVTAFFSPDLVSNKIGTDKPRFREDDRNDIKGSEQITSSSTLGMLLNYKIGKNWLIESGLTYSTRGTAIDPKKIYARADSRGDIKYRVSCSAGYSYVTIKSGAAPAAGDSIMALSSKNTLRYVGIPLALKYNIAFGKISLQTGLGVNANFLSGSKIETVVASTSGNEKVASGDIIGLRDSYFNGSVSLGALYNLNGSFALSFVPIMRFALTSINKDAPVKTSQSSIGLAAGFSMNF
jgi:hypothetical protein